MGKPDFSIAEIDSFGDVAAEDDAVLDYFLTTNAVTEIAKNDVFLVLGRKGSGKTALVRHFCEGNRSINSLSLSLRGYPWNVHEQRIDKGASDIEAYVTSWRFLIVAELASLLLSRVDPNSIRETRSLKRFLDDNYGKIDVELGAILRPKRLRLSKASFEPTVLGNKLGGVSLDRGPGDHSFGLELNTLTDSLLEAIKIACDSLDIPNLFLHFDELDQGLSTMDENRIKMLIGLILAARSIRLKCRGIETSINPIVYLRTDIWDDLEFSDKNKISETVCLHIEWDSESLRKLVDVRIQSKFTMKSDWDTIISPNLMRGSQTKWNHILARTFYRPRDVIKYLNAALLEAKKRTKSPLTFENEDIVAARDKYSAYLKEELDDEILPHWSHWDEALQACSAISTITFDREKFVKEYGKRRSGSNEIGPDEALKLLFRFSVIGYERRSGYGGSSWAFQYSDPEAGWDNSSTKFKVHLGLKEYAKLREERRL